MNRLTVKGDTGEWRMKGIQWEEIDTRLYGALCKLKAYEDTGLMPDEVEKLNTFDGSQCVLATAKFKEEQRRHQWIPVSKALPHPDEQDFYTVCLEDGFITTTKYTKENGFELWEESGEVIAWMPWPEPYSK